MNEDKTSQTKQGAGAGAAPSFYRKLIGLALPIILQQIVGVSLNLVDNIMIGRLGALPLAAVGAANQVYSIYTMVLFGLFSGAAVPLAQYFGVRDFKSIRKILGMDIAIGLVLGLLTVGSVQVMAPQIIALFADEAQVIEMGVAYIRIAAVTYLTTGISFAISFNSRSVQSLKVPTIINVCCILANTVLNYGMIYGHFGFPAMGVEGAALATVIARLIEMTALIVYLCVDRNHPFHGKIREFLGFSRALFRSVMRTAVPVVISEGGWALGMSLTFAAYGRISAQALAVIQVCQVLCNLCQCASFGFGNACAALLGASLGRKETELARINAKQYLNIQWALNGLMCLLILLLRRPVALFYNFDAQTTELLMISMAMFGVAQIPRMVAYSVQNGILRPGGDTLFCMVVELSCNLGLEVALAFFAVLVLRLPLHLCILVASGGNVLKAVLEYKRYLSLRWLNTII